MRSDMAKVVTEAPRRGHANSSKKWGRRLRKDEYGLDDHGPARASTARRRQYSDPKDFSDLLGPLRRYLRKQVLQVASDEDIRRYRVDRMRVWERRDCGWFIHTYRAVPEQLIRVVTRSDGRDVPIYSTPYRERVATKQASKKEIRDALPLLQRDAF